VKAKKGGSMKRALLLLGVVLSCSWFMGVAPAFADGLIIIERPDHRHPVHMPGPVYQYEVLPVKYHRVSVNIENQVAVTSIDQVFRNEYDVDLEGTYIFPLPEDAAISEFSMYIDGKKVTGEILDKDKARQVYEDIVRQMKDPGLLEYMGRNMFRARIYPIPKHGEKRMQLTYQQTLKYDSGMFKYVYPLNTEKFSPRPLEEVTISATVKSAVPIKNVYSPSHKVDTKLSEYSATCGFEEKNVNPDKDFVLYYTVSEKDLGLNLICHRLNNEDGHFMLLVSPGQLEGKNIDKDIIFVLDTSGSMQGEKIKQAKDALRFCVNKLSKGDRFNIVSFSTNVDLYKTGLVQAEETNVKAAIEFINRFDGSGGTNINDALLTTLKMFDDAKRPRMIVFLTDGEATVGVTDMNKILKNISDADTSMTRMFVFGVGNDVNSHLLDKIAEEHRGLPAYVAPGENIEVSVSSFYAKISEPVLSDTALDFGKIKVSEIYPITLPDIFKGTQLVLMGRYSGDGQSAITLKGNVDGKSRSWTYENTFAKENKDNSFIPRLWAQRKIGYLTGEIRLKGQNKELVDEIVKLSKRYGIMTPYTSFLILENETDYRRWGIREEFASRIQSNGDQYALDMAEHKGAQAISKAKDILSQKEEATVRGPSMDTVKYALNKTFYLKDKTWIDSEYKEGAAVKQVKYLSAEYFELLKQKPGLAQYFAVDKDIVVVYEGHAYQVVE
jgi:Ca-activated chloride channel family protein